MSELQHLDNKNFKEFLKSKDVVLVDFFATWCGPCKMLSPVLSEVSKEVGDTYAIAKVDIDEQYDLAKTFGIMSVPTMIIFEKGEERQRLIGYRQKQDIINALKGE